MRSFPHVIFQHAPRPFCLIALWVSRARPRACVCVYARSFFRFRKEKSTRSHTHTVTVTRTRSTRRNICFFTFEGVHSYRTAVVVFFLSSCFLFSLDSFYYCFIHSSVQRKYVCIFWAFHQVTRIRFVCRIDVAAMPTPTPTPTCLSINKRKKIVWRWILESAKRDRFRCDTVSVMDFPISYKTSNDFPHFSLSFFYLFSSQYRSALFTLAGHNVIN